MPSTIDHVGIYAPKDQFESIIDWYKKALAPLNYKEIMRFPGAVGLGSETPDFWISETDEQYRGCHFAFIAPALGSARRKLPILRKHRSYTSRPHKNHAGYSVSLPGLTTMVSGRSEAIVVVTAVFLGLSLIAGCLRCFVRFRLTRAAGCDDCVMVAAMFFNIGFGTCTILGATYGMGKKLVYFEDQPQNYRKAMLVGEIESADSSSVLTGGADQCFRLGQLFYVVTSVIVRLSITITLVRLTVDILQRRILYAATVLSIIAGSIFFFFTIFQCTPVPCYWNRLTEEGHCMDMDSLVGIVYMYSAAAAVCDFTLGLMPVFMIGKLKMDRQTKIAVISLLSIGCVAGTAVIVRIPFVQLSKSREFLYQTTQVAIWSNIETGLGITAGSLMTPRLDDILNDVAPFPYTLGAFIAFLSEHQCLETVEFLLETERYRRIYHWLETPHKPPTCDGSLRKVHLLGLWNRLINQYIWPHSPREINVPCDIRKELMQHFHSQEDEPPPPELLDRAVNNIKELLRGSILIPFLRRSSATARVQPLSMPCLNEGFPGSDTAAPCVADDIRVKRSPREEYPSCRQDSTRRYGFYGDPASSSADDDHAYASSAMVSSSSERSAVQDFAVKGSSGTASSHTRVVPDRTSQDNGKSRGWRQKFKDGLARHFPRSSD
ncbi:uncharacterized protein CDV56_107655 [Aspergillus thermomutatus]|uniref:RGS domain-containing protein n=1 Tax=Aspergillus thermomutatus TaxID=41047 RepID=A0A397HKP5_ASPTH|nr:uncharacterized protein CDV56_107655 [Aspergillus thermomutatus]RHZ61813.1 hypothetical protein CDV56_107655 [Aspergillus thermomutatus]